MPTASDFARDKLQYLRSTFSSSLQAGNNQITIGWRQLEKQHYETFCFGCRVLNAQCLVLQMVLCLHYITLIGEKISFTPFQRFLYWILNFYICMHPKYPLQYCLIQVKAFPCSATLELCVNRYTGISMVPIWATGSHTCTFFVLMFSCDLFIFLGMFSFGVGGWCSVNCCLCLTGTYF